MGRLECWNCHAEYDDTEPGCPACRAPRPETAAPLAPLTSNAPWLTRLKLLALLVAVLGFAVAAYSVLTTGELPIVLEAANNFLKTPPADEKERQVSLPPEKKQPTKDWKIYGRLYDLITLDPISGAEIRLQAQDAGTQFKVQTDSGGNYSLTVPKLDMEAYTISVSHPHYGKRYLEDSTPPYRSLSLLRRKKALELIKSLRILHVPLSPPMEVSHLEFDLVMAHE